MMEWAKRVAEKRPVFRGRCEWCAKVLGGFVGVEVAMPGPGNTFDGCDYHRFCDDDCAKAYDAAEEKRHRHKDHPETAVETVAQR